jgi:hypothetical protein
VDVLFYYLAYGSNLPTLRMLDRTSTNVMLKEKFAWSGQRLAFSKRSTDGSAKCTVVATGNEHVVWGAIYQLTAADKHKLAEAEAGYHEVLVWLSVDGEQKPGFTFVADTDQIDNGLYPYIWYKRYVFAGAHEHDFPADYISQIERVTAWPDPNRVRSAGHEALLAQVEQAPPSRATKP